MGVCSDSVPGYEVEWASPTGLALLDEMRVSMIECLLVLAALPGEVDLNLDELRTDLRSALDSARQAYRAASLLNQGAVLAPAWGTGLSRPQAVFARHHSAVRDGAEHLLPMPSETETLEDQLAHRPADHELDKHANARGEGQRAAGVGISADWLARRQDTSRWFHEAQSMMALTDR